MRFRLKNGSAGGRMNSTSSAATNPVPKWTIGSRPRRNCRPRWKKKWNGTEDRELKRTQFLLVAGLWCCSLFGQAVKPDFSGTWKLNNGKSTQDGAADRVYIGTIAQAKASITVSTKAEGVTNPLDGTFPINGKDKIEKNGDKYHYTKVSWEGSTLVFRSEERRG